MMFSRRLSGTDSQVASLGTECNQNLKVCVYRLQRLLSFVGLLYSLRKVRSICLIILQTLTLYQQFFPDWPRRSQAKNCFFRMRILHLSFFIVEIVKLFGAICMVLGKTLQFIWPLICQRSWNTVIILNIGTDRSEQTVQTQIRLLLMEQSDQGLLCLLFCLHLLNTLLHCKIQLFQL